MAKIFISYRRDDSAAYALSICQYLEKEFGRRNVFIDVDMSAGAKFPEVLERRLAKCKVLLALIGPNWLYAPSDHGGTRLDDPADWVRLEISSALKRDVTVIPVCVGGAELPKKSSLPEDICSLVDHQAVTVSTPGFRNEMNGLARDIRAIPTRWSSKYIWIAAGATIVLAGLIAINLHDGSKKGPSAVAPPEPNAGKNAICVTPRGNCYWNVFIKDNQGCMCFFAGDNEPNIGVIKLRPGWQPKY